MVITVVEWAAIGGAIVILLGLVGFLVRDRLFGIDRRHAKEVADREAGDVELAKLIKEVAVELNSHKVKEAESRAEWAVLNTKVDDLRDSLKAIFAKLERNEKTLEAMRETYVTKDFCEARHG